MRDKSEVRKSTTLPPALMPEVFTKSSWPKPTGQVKYLRGSQRDEKQRSRTCQRAPLSPGCGTSCCTFQANSEA